MFWHLLFTKNLEAFWTLLQLTSSYITIYVNNYLHVFRRTYFRNMKIFWTFHLQVSLSNCKTYVFWQLVNRKSFQSFFKTRYCFIVLLYFKLGSIPRGDSEKTTTVQSFIRREMLMLRGQVKVFFFFLLFIVHEQWIILDRRMFFFLLNILF